ncbi:hypothetical protein HERIO_1961 [Hepatospora eriocheir]|uniref:Uncharacterized protein n=1 Tax=Hepatospora eriocheir TaxID=1081669 RepID=A0A1X0Q8K0_9MICR|nr:hypothetical protein HERIO_1961 [Hepatospora eriocheir]
MILKLVKILKESFIKTIASYYVENEMTKDEARAILNSNNDENDLEDNFNRLYTINYKSKYLQKIIKNAHNLIKE